ncbi:MAG: hypothetical protein AB2805_18520 [Candidatus Thiodiazotropha sp.]
MDNNDIEKAALTEESASVQSHLSIMQSVIQRMSANSTSCKAWCITIVSAILVLIADKNKPELAWLALLPTFLFLALDAYYLALEKAFRSSYNNFIKKLHNHELYSADLYSVAPVGNMSSHQIDSLKSFSVWGFYGALFILVVLAKELVLR